VIDYNDLQPVKSESDADDSFLNRFNTRHEIALLAPKGSVGGEFGVDEGQLSERFLALNHFSSFHCVDKWDPENDKWDTEGLHSRQQYLDTSKRLMKYEGARVWRMTAQEFAELVPDEMFGFMYIDCYAHTGQDDGEVLRVLWPKLAPGGVFAGDDYCEQKWPATFHAVNEFAREIEKEVQINDAFCRENIVTVRNWQDANPTWYWYK
jgi:hypothetical protein